MINAEFAAVLTAAAGSGWQVSASSGPQSLAAVRARKLFNSKCAFMLRKL